MRDWENIVGFLVFGRRPKRFATLYIANFSPMHFLCTFIHFLWTIFYLTPHQFSIPPKDPKVTTKKLNNRVTHRKILLASTNIITRYTPIYLHQQTKQYSLVDGCWNETLCFYATFEHIQEENSSSTISMVPRESFFYLPPYTLIEIRISECYTKFNFSRYTTIQQQAKNSKQYQNDIKISTSKMALFSLSLSLSLSHFE